MATVETLAGLDPELYKGFRLAMAREMMGAVISSPETTEEHYADTVAEYLNSFHDVHFISGQDEDRKEDYAYFSRAIKTEVECMADGVKLDVQEVESILLGYCKDDRAEWLSSQNYPVMPRAAIHTLLDIIDNIYPVQNKIY